MKNQTKVKAFSAVHYNKDDYPSLLYPGGEFMVRASREEIQDLAQYCNSLLDRIATLEAERWRHLR